MESLREACRNKFKLIFESLKLDTSSGSSILVTDDHSLRILSSFMKMSELVNYGISAIEKISLKRKRFQKLEAIYLLSHTPESVERLLGDYLDQDSAQYLSVHVFFTTSIHSTTMDKIANNQILTRRIKTFKELHLEYLCATQRQFILDLTTPSQSFKNFYVSKGIAYTRQQDAAVNRLASIVASFPKFYSVEILYGKTEACNVGEKIAVQLSSLLEGMFRDFEECGCEQYDKKAPKITLFVLDRAYDPVSPLVRDFHYLSLLTDLKGSEFQNFQIEYSDPKYTKKMNLDENDEIYTKYKYRHIADLLTGVSQDFKMFIESNTAAKFEKNQGDTMSTGKMADLLKKIPQYQETKQKYSLHTRLISELFDTYKEKALNVVGDLEQTIITGINSKGNTESDKQNYVNIISCLEKQKDPNTRARLATIALICLDLKASEKSQLEAVLEKMGSPYNLVPKSLHFLTGGRIFPKLKENQQKSVILNRHMPKIEYILNEFLTRGSKGDLKSLKINGDGKVVGPSTMVRKKIGQGTMKDIVQNERVIVYIAGGIGYNEVRCVNKFANKYTVISGSNALMSPTEYLRVIGMMCEESKGSSNNIDEEL